MLWHPGLTPVNKLRGGAHFEYLLKAANSEQRRRCSFVLNHSKLKVSTLGIFSVTLNQRYRLSKSFQVSYDHRSYERNLSNCV